MSEVELPCGRVFLIDDADLHLLDGFNLHADARPRTVYVRARLPGESAGGRYVHNMIVGGLADHRDGNGLDNRRSNLRPCTRAQNGLNRAPKAGKRFKGVFFDKRRGQFYAQIGIGGVRRSSPRMSEEDAARWYDAQAMELHGDFARLNFPIEAETHG